MTCPLVSVVIPTYNRPDLLLQALASVFAQTFTDYEVIVVNDGSTDDTLKRLEPFASRVRIISQDNRGIGAARNRGIDESRGKYVATLDHDDWWLPGKLAAQAALLEGRAEFIACSVPYATSQDPGRSVFEREVVAGADRVVRHPFLHLAAGRVFCGTSALMFDRRRADGIRYGTVRGAIEDIPFHIRLLARGPFGIAGDEVLAVWRTHGTNFSSRASYHYAGIKLLRQMQRRGDFAQTPTEQSGELEEYLAAVGRRAAVRQLADARRRRGVEIYLRELPHQLRRGRIRFVAAFPLLLLLPSSILARPSHPCGDRAASLNAARAAELRRLWADRKRYARARDWLWSLYNRLLNSRPGRHFPLRGSVRVVRLKGVDRPFYLRLGTTDWMVLNELFFERGYSAIFSEPLAPVRRIIDLGANIGLSMRLWQMHYSGARAIGVEPDEGNLRMCRRNLDASDPSSNVELVRACAVSRKRMVYLDTRLGEWAMQMRDAADNGTVAVPGMTLPELLDRFGDDQEIDLLKCDIEGAERELFGDCGKWIHRVRNILVELHSPYTKEQFVSDVERTGAGFTVKCLGEGSGYCLMLLMRPDASRSALASCSLTPSGRSGIAYAGE